MRDDRRTARARASWRAPPRVAAADDGAPTLHCISSIPRPYARCQNHGFLIAQRRKPTRGGGRPDNGHKGLMPVATGVFLTTSPCFGNVSFE